MKINICQVHTLMMNDMLVIMSSAVFHFKKPVSTNTKR